MVVTYETVDCKEKEEAIIRAVQKTNEIQSAIDLLESGTDSISVSSEGKTYLCKINSIYYIESVDKKNFVYTKDNCYETKMRLYELEDKLGPYYARCSKAMIVNLKKVKNVNSEIGARMIATLLNGEEIVISRSYVKDIKRRLDI